MCKRPAISDRELKWITSAARVVHNSSWTRGPACLEVFVIAQRVAADERETCSRRDLFLETS